VGRTQQKFSRLEAALILNRASIPQEVFIQRLLGLAVATAFGSFAVELALSPSFLLSVLIATALGGVLSGCSVLILFDRSTKIRRSLVASYPALLERVSMLVGSGRSLTGSFEQLSKDRQGPWTPWLVDIHTHLQQGHGLADELSTISALLHLDEIDRLVEVVSVHSLTAELPWLLSNEMEVLQRRRRLQLTETLEKRSQLVWIPVSVAILIPGTLLLVIPLISALKFFGGV
jgi:Flp pilus assembly protein TadB